MARRLSTHTGEHPLKAAEVTDLTGLVGWRPRLVMAVAALGLAILVFTLMPSGLDPQHGKETSAEWGPLAARFVAASFLGAGWVLLRGGLRGALRSLRWRRRPNAAAHEVDFPGATLRHRAIGVVLECAFAGVFLLIFAAPFHWLALGGEEIIGWLALMVLGIDLVAVILVVAAGFWWLHHRKHGDALLRPSAFPLSTGTKVGFRLSATRTPFAFERLTATLRCLEWRRTSVRSRGRRTTFWQPVQIWAATQDLTSPDCQPSAEGLIDLDFDVPATQPGTHLAAEPYVYWALVIVGHGASNTETHLEFLVPIYR